MFDASFDYSNGSEGGAVLICGRLMTETIDRNLSHVKKWAKANAKKIFQKEGDTERLGFFLVTATHCAKEYHMKCWSGTKTDVAAGAGTSSSPAPLGSVGGDLSRSTTCTHGTWISSLSEMEMVSSNILEIH